jgi:RNA polymerase sigma-70 factor (ECF subfamily)
MTYSSLSCDELVRACVDSGNAEAWQEFVCRFEKLIGLIILRVTRRYGETRREIIEELVQDTYVKICIDNCRLLRNFEFRHENAFLAMLKVVARNVALDHFRKLPKPGIIVDCEISEIEGFIRDPQPSQQETLERKRQFERFDNILAEAFSQRDRDIFWLYWRQGFTAGEIADLKIFKSDKGGYLTEKGVESILYRMKCYLCMRYGNDQNSAAS